MKRDTEFMRWYTPHAVYAAASVIFVLGAPIARAAWPTYTVVTASVAPNPSAVGQVVTVTASGSTTPSVHSERIAGTMSWTYAIVSVQYRAGEADANGNQVAWSNPPDGSWTQVSQFATTPNSMQSAQMCFVPVGEYKVTIQGNVTVSAINTTDSTIDPSNSWAGQAPATVVVTVQPFTVTISGPTDTALEDPITQQACRVDYTATLQGGTGSGLDQYTWAQKDAGGVLWGPFTNQSDPQNFARYQPTAVGKDSITCTVSEVGDGTEVSPPYSVTVHNPWDATLVSTQSTFGPWQIAPAPVSQMTAMYDGEPVQFSTVTSSQVSVTQGVTANGGLSYSIIEPLGITVGASGSLSTTASASTSVSAGSTDKDTIARVSYALWLSPIMTVKTYTVSQWGCSGAVSSTTVASQTFSGSSTCAIWPGSGGPPPPPQ